MTPAQLQARTRDELAQLARRRGVAGWKSLKKAELVEALSTGAPAKSSPKGARTTAKTRPAKSVKSAQVNGHAPAPPAAKSPAKKGTKSTSKPGSQAKLPAPVAPSMSRDLSPAQPTAKERFVLLVRDPYWLQVIWELSRDTIRRAEAALGFDWHRSVPILRLIDTAGRDVSTAGEKVLREFEIHGGVNTWFIPLDGQARSYRAQIGYKTPAGRVHILARSNVVTPPRPGSPGSLTGVFDDLAQDGQRIYMLSGGYSENVPQPQLKELFEERLGQPLESLHAALDDQDDNRSSTGNHLPLSLHVEVLLRGRTEPDAKLVVPGATATVEPDGSFQLRMRLDDGRLLIPTSVTRHDGSAQRTIVISVERNTRELDRPTTALE